jgi:hypothetical protein
MNYKIAKTLALLSVSVFANADTVSSVEIASKCSAILAAETHAIFQERTDEEYTRSMIKLLYQYRSANLFLTYSSPAGRGDIQIASKIAQESDNEHLVEIMESDNEREVIKDGISYCNANAADVVGLGRKILDSAYGYGQFDKAVKAEEIKLLQKFGFLIIE